MWVRPGGDPTVVRVGITDFAQDSLGDVVDVTLPDPGAGISAEGLAVRSSRPSR